MARRSRPSALSRLRATGLPTLRQAGTIAVLLVVIVLCGLRLAGLVGELRETHAKRVELEAKRAELEDRHRDLETQASFVSDPDHLEQELRARYNYKKPGERVIVVVPPATTTSSTAP